nr:MAG TPA: hypothetical protein [Caudoviricetes sp.]
MLQRKKHRMTMKLLQSWRILGNAPKPIARTIRKKRMRRPFASVRSARMTTHPDWRKLLVLARSSKKIKSNRMDASKIFPLLLIALQLGAAVVYAIRRDGWMSVYWAAAAILNVAVVFRPQ